MNYSTLQEVFPTNQTVGEKVLVLAGTGLESASYLSGKIIKTNLLYQQTSYPDLFSQIGHNTVGASLTALTSGTSSSIFALLYDNSKYIAAGVAGMLRTSTDLVTWTNQTSGTSNTIRTLVYLNNLYLLGGDNGALCTSTDGISWTPRISNTTSSINSITYGAGKYVYAAADLSLNQGYIGTSTDGINWTNTTITAGISSITYGAGKYVAVGGTGSGG